MVKQFSGLFNEGKWEWRRMDEEEEEEEAGPRHVCRDVVCGRRIVRDVLAKERRRERGRSSKMCAGEGGLRRGGHFLSYNAAPFPRRDHHSETLCRGAFHWEQVALDTERGLRQYVVWDAAISLTIP